MNTVLIAEDEKLLRMGLRTMTERVGVQINEILEARDGQEALEILRRRRVDLLITDIKMPNMDGIELVSHLSELEYIPSVIVVSGYDDFSYAVEMLRNGAQDYLLKPVEREKLYSAVKKAETLYQERVTAKETRERGYLDALRRLMLEPYPKGEEWEEQLRRYDGEFFTGAYVGFCAGRAEKKLPDNVLKLHTIGSVMFYAIVESECGRLAQCFKPPIGKSNTHNGLKELHICYEEAYGAWRESFFTEKVCTPKKANYKPLNTTAEQLAGLIGLSKRQEASNLLRSESSRVFGGEADPNEFAALCEQFIGTLADTYSDFVGDVSSVKKYGSIWDFGSVENYLKALDEYLDEFCTGTEAAFSNFENKHKIRQAVQYVRVHFREQLNMAEVSNRVSMNYSLFSTLFKETLNNSLILQGKVHIQ